MNYPMREQIYKADGEQLREWLISLPHAINERDEEILRLIQDRYIKSDVYQQLIQDVNEYVKELPYVGE